MVDEIVTRQELIDAKRDARDLGEAVNEVKIVSPRYGEDFKSLPMISAEAQNTINEWQDAVNTIVVNDGVPALAVSDASGKNQQEINYGLTDVSKLIELDPKSYSNVYVQAYTYGGDKNGGGRFWHDETDSTTTVDNVYVFLSKTGKRWKRIIDGDVNVAMAGIVDTSDYQTEKLQALFDGCPDDKEIDFLGLTVKVDKELGASSKWSEYSEKNDQPAVVLYNKNGVRLKNGKIKVDRHGLGAIDFCKSKNCKIAWSMKLEGPGLDKIPPIDRNSGYAEKGIESIGTLGQAGFYHPTIRNAPSTGYFRNNCLDTSGFTSNGYQGNFPKWGGGTSSTFGIWNNGYPGNYGMGLGVVESDDCGFFGESYGFNGSGVWLRSFDGFTIGFPAKLHDNYSAGYEVVSWTEDGMSTRRRLKINGAEIYNNGHPNASKDHIENDPGYGGSTNHGYDPVDDITITNCNIYGNKRKPIDFHALSKAYVYNNPLIQGARGVVLAVQYRSANKEYLEVVGNHFVLEGDKAPKGARCAAIDFSDLRYTPELLADKALTAILNNNTIDIIGKSKTEILALFADGFTDFAAVPKGIVTYGAFKSVTCNGNIIRLLSGYGEYGIALGNDYTGSTNAGTHREDATCVGNTVIGKFIKNGIREIGASNFVIQGNTIDLTSFTETAAQLTSDFGTFPSCVYAGAVTNQNGRNTESISGNTYKTPYLAQSHSILNGDTNAVSRICINKQIAAYVDLSNMTVSIDGGEPQFSQLSPTITWDSANNCFSISGLIPQNPKSVTFIPLRIAKAKYSGSGDAQFEVYLVKGSASYDSTHVSFRVDVQAADTAGTGVVLQPMYGRFRMIVDY